MNYSFGKEMCNVSVPRVCYVFSLPATENSAAPSNQPTPQRRRLTRSSRSALVAAQVLRALRARARTDARAGARVRAGAGSRIGAGARLGWRSYSHARSSSRRCRCGLLEGVDCALAFELEACALADELYSILKIINSLYCRVQQS